jgi:hypothetical protein
MIVKPVGRASLRRKLKKEGIANTSRDLDIAAEWFPLEEQAALTLGIAESIAEFQARKGYGPFDSYEAFLKGLHKQKKKEAGRQPHKRQS